MVDEYFTFYNKKNGGLAIVYASSGFEQIRKSTTNALL